MLSKANRYRTMQMMFYPRVTSNNAKVNAVDNSLNPLGKSKKSKYAQLINTDSYSKFDGAYKDFQKRLRAVRDGADELLNLTNDIKAPVSKEFGEKLNKKGEVFAQALDELQRTFINPRAKQADKTVEKMNKALEDGKEYWEKIGVSFEQDGKFSLDVEKFSNAVKDDPMAVADGLSELKGMSGKVKDATELSQKDKYSAGMAWYTANQPAKYTISNYTATGTGRQSSFWERKGGIVDGFL